MDAPVFHWRNYQPQQRLYHLAFMQSDSAYAYGRHTQSEQGESDEHSLKGQGFQYFNLAFPVFFLERLEASISVADPEAKSPLAALRETVQPPLLVLDQAQRRHLEDGLADLLRDYDPLGFLVLITWVMELLVSSLQPLAGRIRGGFTMGEETDLPPWLASVLDRTVRARTVPSLGQLREWAGRTPEHLARTFQRYLRCTPTQFLLNLRLERACRFLERSNHSLKQIYDLTGFDNANYFHKLFRQRYGCSPGDWRKANAELSHW